MWNPVRFIHLKVLFIIWYQVTMIKQTMIGGRIDAVYFESIQLKRFVVLINEIVARLSRAHTELLGACGQGKHAGRRAKLLPWRSASDLLQTRYSQGC